MIKKLMPFICLAAVLMLTAPAVTAQQSATADVTYGRIKGDVDNIFDVNDWKTVEYSKWFNYLKIQPVTGTNPWETGLVLQFSKIHLALFYKGAYNSGTVTEGTIEVGPDGQTNGTNVATTAGGITWPTSFTANKVTHDNEYKVLVGAGKNSFMFKLVDKLEPIEGPVYAQYDIAEKPGKDGYNAIPEGSSGYYRQRNGSITPELTWGAAEDISIGKYKTKPKASVKLAVVYSNNEELVFGDTIIRNGAAGSSLTPTLGADTGRITIWSGDWGTFRVGAAEEFSTKITGEGNEKAVPWENKIQPYAVFSYNPVEYFTLGARIDVPVWFGSSGDTGGTGGTPITNTNFFGVGQKAAGATPATTTSAAAPYTYTPSTTTLQVGFKLKGSFLEDKTGFLDRLSLNCGLQVYLPAYLYSGTYTDYATATPPENKYTKNYKHEWIKRTDLQDVNWGLTFNITPNIVLDTKTSFAFTDSATGGFNIFQDRLPPTTVMLSIKHNGPKKAAVEPQQQPKAVEQPVVVDQPPAE